MNTAIARFWVSDLVTASDSCGGKSCGSSQPTFADPHFVLGDGVAIERGADHTAQSPVACSMQPVDSPAALVLLPGAHEAAAADAQHDTPRAVLGLLALGLVAR